MESTNDTYLENLPLDVFIHLVDTGGIENVDLIRLCSTSSKIRTKCEARNQEVYRKAIFRTYGIKDLRGYRPKTFLMLFKFSISSKVGYLDRYRRTNQDKLGFLIPDKVIEIFANSLNVTVDRLLKSEIFTEIINQHRTISFYSTDNIIDPNSLDINKGYNSYERVPWVPGESVNDGEIPIIWSSDNDKNEDIEKPEYYGPEPGGHGNFTIDYSGDIVEIKDKLGRTKNHIDRNNTRYPTRQAAEDDARKRKEYIELDKRYRAQFNKFTEYVIVGIILLNGQLEKLKNELNTREFKFFVTKDNCIPSKVIPFETPVEDDYNNTVVNFTVLNPKTKQKGLVFGSSGKYGSNSSYFVFYNDKEELIINKRNNRIIFDESDVRKAMEMLEYGIHCQEYYGTSYILFEVELP